MRHRNKTNSLGRTASHRKALLSNMATSLIMHKRIKTTLAKAKVLRSYVEPIITRTKDDKMHNRRMVFRDLKNKYAVSELFNVIGPKTAERNGGYTRILKIGHRLGDNAEMCIIELVDFNTTYSANTNKKKATRKRKSRRSSKKSNQQNVAQNSDANKVDVQNSDTSKQVENTDE